MAAPEVLDLIHTEPNMLALLALMFPLRRSCSSVMLWLFKHKNLVEVLEANIKYQLTLL